MFEARRPCNDSARSATTAFGTESIVRSGESKRSAPPIDDGAMRIRTNRRFPPVAGDRARCAIGYGLTADTRKVLKDLRHGVARVTSG